MGSSLLPSPSLEKAARMIRGSLFALKNFLEYLFHKLFEGEWG
jgi:hypothetical protein